MIIIEELGVRNLSDIAAIHERAFPDSLITALGTSAVVRYYRHLLMQQPLAIKRGVFVDGSLAGFCFYGVFKNSLSGYLRSNKLFLSAMIAIRPWVLLHAEYWDRLRLGRRLALARIHADYDPSNAVSLVDETLQYGILSIATHPEYQGQGIGGMLLTNVEDDARKAGCAHIHLTVHPQNVGAIRFYLHCGWLIKGDAHPNIISMEKALI